MREIKFRQRIKGPLDFPDYWHYWGYIEEHGHFVGPIALVEWDARESQQYTGLNDKNGKEVYEGDRVKADDIYIATVEWDENGSWMIGEYAPWDVEYLEVIGNIYENPELTP